MRDPIRAKIKSLVDSLGGSTVAELLQVDRSQPSRWKSGKSNPSAEARARILDLEYVLARLEEIYEPAVAVDWLLGINAFLGSRRPIDVMRVRGVTEVVEAIRAEAGLAFA